MTEPYKIWNVAGSYSKESLDSTKGTKSLH